MSRNADGLTPYVLSFAVNNPWSRQSDIFESFDSKMTHPYHKRSSIFLIDSEDRSSCYVLFKICIVGLIENHQRNLIRAQKVPFLIFLVMLVEY